MKKHFAAIALASVCLAATMTGCTVASADDSTSTSNNANSSADSTAEDIVLDLYFPVGVGGGVDTLVSALCDEYSAETDGVSINAVYTGSYDETLVKILAATSANDYPAVAVSQASGLYTFLAQDMIYAFDDYCTTEEDQAWIDGFFPAFMENSQLDGVTYGIPFQRSTVIMYYNKEMYAEAGLDPETPPTTWDELYEYAELLTNDDHYGYEVSSAGAIWTYQAYVNQQGVDLCSADGLEAYFNSDEAVTALEYWYSFSEAGYQPAGVIAWDSLTTDFYAETVAMICTSTGNLTGIKNTATFDFGTAILPGVTTSGSPTGGGNLYLFKGADDSETAAAFDFIQWLTNDADRVAQWSIDTGYIATRMEAYETDLMTSYLEEFPQAAVARDQLDTASREFSTYDNANVSSFLNDSIEAVFSGAISVQDALDQAQAQADALLADYQ